MGVELSEDARSQVAEAVHAAVCEANGDDGYGRCADYAVVGSLVLNLLTDRRYSPQVGGVDILCSPPDRYFHVCGEDNGLARGEYHAWIASAAGPAPGRPGLALASEWVDFSARHWRRMAETMPSVDRLVHQDEGTAIFAMSPKTERVRWTAPEPPLYLWHEGAVPPPHALFYVDEASCWALMGRLNGDMKGRFFAMTRLATARLGSLFVSRRAALAARITT